MKRSTLNTAVAALLDTDQSYQCYGLLYDGNRNYCANGVIALALGVFITPYRQRGTSTLNLLESEFGIPAGYIQMMNDFDRYKFAEIAKWLESCSDRFVTEEDLVPDHVPSEWSELVEA